MQLSLGGHRLVISWARPEPPGPPPTSNQSEIDDTDAPVRRDLMRTHSRKVASLLLIIALALLVGSFGYGARDGLPSVALDWLFGLQLIRAAVAFAIVALLLMLIVRGWGGLWPERLLTTGLEYPAAERAVEQGLAESAKLVTAIRHEIEPVMSDELRG